MIHSFIAHVSPGRSRVFALIKDPRERLEVVTTLGAADLALSDDLVEALNGHLFDQKDPTLGSVLDRAPNPVRMAVRQYLQGMPTLELGTFTPYGPVGIVREAVYFGRIDDELEEYLDGAYMIGLGIRMSNERQADGGVGWVVQLRDDEVSVPASAEPRTWALPTDLKLLSNWTSEQPLGGRGPVRSALEVAEAASREGRWVRIHTLLHSDRDEDYEGNGTSEFVVDVFDAPIPLSEPDE
ncbi:hypothetical protein ABZX99_30520 [Streptomyces antibioticus]|uniref:hypothetical protein n=1 Tax=Streptomyces antibioticus TaxID=1890 RepID=UPI00196079FB|nr:hypothetical protein [Streptomyces sp. S9]